MLDKKIIELFFGRDENAIEELSLKYGKLCKRVSFNILNNELDAEECVNDTYLAIWNKIPPERPNPLKTYLLRITRNLSLKKYQANTAQKRNSHYDIALEELEDCLTDYITAEKLFYANDLSKQINLFLSTLDTNSRVIFVRRYWYGDSVKDIAKMFHTRENSVSVRLSRIREKLKNHLTKEGYEL